MIFSAGEQMNSKSSKSELKAFFNSPATRNLKEQMCDIGHRMWQREYADGNGGNLAVRVGKDIAQFLKVSAGETNETKLTSIIG